jgi:hypothetical protein
MRGFAVFVMMVVAFAAMPAMAIEPRIALVVGTVFRRVRAQMVKSGSQKPWESNAMLRGFAFIGEAQ